MTLDIWIQYRTQHQAVKKRGLLPFLMRMTVRVLCECYDVVLFLNQDGFVYVCLLSFLGWFTLSIQQ